MIMKSSFVYSYQDNLYVNLTNRCPARCVFCVKNKWSYRYRGYNLKLLSEPSADDVIRALKARFPLSQYKEIVFCGYGEPFIRLGTLKRVAEWLKKDGLITSHPKIRVDTIGYAKLIYQRNILPEIKGLFDAISISLNAENEDKYLLLCRPRYGKGTYSAILDFARECKKYIPRVTLTAVEVPGIDLDKCKEIAGKLGVLFRSRPYLDRYEDK